MDCRVKVNQFITDAYFAVRECKKNIFAIVRNTPSIRLESRILIKLHIVYWSDRAYWCNEIISVQNYSCLINRELRSGRIIESFEY